MKKQFQIIVLLIMVLSATAQTPCDSINFNITQIDTSICFGDSVVLSVGNTNIYSACALPTNLQNGLVAYYPFCGNANDESGNSNNGTVSGAILSADRFGNTNSAYSFNGINCCGIADPVQEIVITDTLLDLSKDFTISCWMKSTDINKYQQCLFNSINHTGFAVELNNEHVPTKLMYAVGPSNAYWDLLYAQGIYNTYQNNTWYHVLFTKNSTNYTIYMNTTFDGSSVVPNSINYTESVGLRIGSIGSGHEIFKGSLDDVGVWSRALSSQEIQEIYNYSPAVQTNPTYIWSTGDTTATIAVAPSQTTTYWVTQNGCTDSVTVTVLPTTSDTSYITACDSVVWNGTTYDSSGTYSYSGAINNTSSLSFNNTSSTNVTMGNILLGLNRSVSFWAKLDQGAMSTNPSSSVLQLASDFIVTFGNWGQSGPKIAVHKSGSWVAAPVIDDGLWHHYAITASHGLGDSIRFYQDGIWSSNTIGNYSYSASNYPFTIGTGLASGLYNLGNIDETHVWDKVLSQTEINQFLLCPPTGLEPNLLGYWNFEEGSGTTAYDQTSNGNNGTINGATYDTNVPSQSCGLTNVNGCDSLAVLDLTINYSLSVFDTTIICSNDSFFVGSNIYTLSGDYIDTLITADGCDSIVYSHIIVNDINIIQQDTTICNSDSLLLQLNGYCDSSQPIIGNLLYSATQSFGSSWNINWSVNVASDYILRVVGTYGIANNSNHLDAAFSLSNQTPYNAMCTGYLDKWRLLDGCPARPISDVYNSNHEYFYFIDNSDGTVNIDFADGAYGDNSGSLFIELYEAYDTCVDNNLLWSTGDTTSTILVSPSQTTTYWVQQTQNGVICIDSVTITVNSDTSYTNITACDSYDWNGQTYTSSSQYTWLGVNSNGCDSVATLNLTINPSTSSTTDVTACDSYDWNGQVINSSGNYTQILTNVFGCDSTHILVVTIFSSNAGSSSVTECDTYTWNGQVITGSGSYNQTFTNANGCDSVHTLVATINYSNTGTSAITACDSYLWNSQTITTSGNYNQTFTNVAGCDSVHTLVPTINYSNTGTTSVTACDTYLWNAQTITSSGNYDQTFTNVAGCDSTHTLVATIIFTTIIYDTISICKGESYVVSSSTYNNTGDYTDTIFNSNGCLSIIYTNLTVGSSLISSITQVGSVLESTVNGGFMPYSYLWNTLATTEDINITSSGLYWLVVTDSLSCPVDTAYYNGVLHTSISEIGISDLKVYPNPSRDIFNIVFSSNTIQNLDVRVINVIGEVIFSEDLDKFIGEYTKQINLHENAKGIYLLEIETNDGVVNKKLILQ